jgi:hypothetical protein
VDEDEDDELTIVVGAGPGASPLERDGMLRRLEESVTLAIAEIATQGYITNGTTDNNEVRLVIAAPGLAATEVLSFVGDSVAALLDDPDVVGWGPFSVSVTDEILPDEPDVTDLRDSLDEDGLDLAPSEAEEFDPEEGRRQLLQDAEYLNDGPDLGWFTALDTQAEDAAERVTALLEAGYVAGALFQASVIVLDDLFEDLDTLRQERFGVTVADASDDTFLVLDELPARYAHRYDTLFAQQLIVTMVDVTRRFTAGWEPLGCVAEELALRLVLNGAELQLELAEVELQEGWRGVVEDALFEDPDHEMLFDASMDGIEDDPESLASLGSASMAFTDWFKPFKAERHLPPYLLDQPDLLALFDHADPVDQLTPLDQPDEPDQPA